MANILMGRTAAVGGLEAAAIIRKSESAELAETMIEELRPSILIDATRVRLQDLPLGASRMGGIPDLPKGFEWPHWNGSKTPA